MVEVLIDSYSESNQSDDFSLYAGGGAQGLGHSFIATANNLARIVLYLKKVGSPTGNAVAKLYAHSGTYGTSSVPGALLATSDNFDVSTLITSWRLEGFTFSGAEQYALVIGTEYVLTIEYSGGNSSNKVVMGFDSSSPTHGGNFMYNISSWIAQSTRDACFYVYGIAAAGETVLVGTESYDSAAGSDTVTNGFRYTVSEAGLSLADIDQNGRADLVFSCENAKGDKSGVMWLSSDGGDRAWTAHEISGPEGIKFDRMELVDVDGDGDTDVIACEESEPVDGKRHGLGLFWYENPTIANRAR